MGGHPHLGVARRRKRPNKRRPATAPEAVATRCVLHACIKAAEREGIVGSK